MSLGYDRSESLTLLSSSCPNNVPAIFWAAGRSWRPLFPHGQVPDDLRSAILDGERVSLGVRLKALGRAYLERGLADENISTFGRQLIALLGASTRFRSPFTRFEQLAMILGLSMSEVAALFDHAQRYRLVDPRGRLTEGGRYELDHLRAQLPADPATPSGEATKPYYPKSLRRQA